MPLLAAIAAAAWLSGCADISQKFAAKMSQAPYVGLPEGSPERPAQQAAYPAVHDMPPPRNDVTLTNFEQQKLQDDLTVARDDLQAKVGAPKTKKDKDKGKASTEKVVPVTSRASIY